MLNKLLRVIRRYGMIAPGDSVVCAVSGGADSVALLFAMYLLRDKLKITLSAAHFNHHLRGAESDRDEAFVREFCGRYEIPLTVAQGSIVPGKKGLEAAAREARYGFLRILPGKIATAHTADDNAETVLMHLVRGTGLKGLGGISPVNGSVIRPMLEVTRADVEAFLVEWGLSYIEDSSNAGDDFLRNRLRHHVMPLLKKENPQLSQNVSAMAQRLRQDESCLNDLSRLPQMDVQTLRDLPPALRSRALERFLKESGIPEPEASHIAQADALVFSAKPSAFARFPGGITISRNYGVLEVRESEEKLPTVELRVPGSIVWGDYRITVLTEPGEAGIALCCDGPVLVRPRQTGDAIRLNSGSKSLKRLMIDRKIPAYRRDRLPVICDEQGILAVHELGVNLERAGNGQRPIWIQIEKRKNTLEEK